MGLTIVWWVVRRELGSYFATPLAYVFLVLFVLLSGFFTFEFGQFFERGQADLAAFFNLHPWLYLLLVPAVAMRLWAEERKTGSIELLLTLPVAVWQAVLGKYLAAWLFLGLALLLTTPLWFSVNYLGEPDNGVILAAYLGSWLMAGAYLAVGSCLSAFTVNQVIAFVLAAAVCLLFVLIGFPMILDAFHTWLPAALLDALANLSFYRHFQSITRGVLDVRDLLYFLWFIALWLLATTVVVTRKKAE